MSASATSKSPNSDIVTTSSTSPAAVGDNNSTGSGSVNKVCKVVIQQCLEASLRFDTSDPPVSIGTGIIVFVCFLQGATQEHLKSIVKSIMNVKLCEPGMPSGSEGGSSGDNSSSNIKRKSVLDCNYDILVIPQATLGGKLKGSAAQYHGLVSKDLGFELFHAFVKSLKEYSNKSWSGKVENGVYGARQILKMDTNGPFTHIFEF